MAANRGLSTEQKHEKSMTYKDINMVIAQWNKLTAADKKSFIEGTTRTPQITEVMKTIVSLAQQKVLEALIPFKEIANYIHEIQAEIDDDGHESSPGRIHKLEKLKKEILTLLGLKSESFRELIADQEYEFYIDVYQKITNIEHTSAGIATFYVRRLPPISSLYSDPFKMSWSVELENIVARIVNYIRSKATTSEKHLNAMKFLFCLLHGDNLENAIINRPLFEYRSSFKKLIEEALSEYNKQRKEIEKKRELIEKIGVREVLPRAGSGAAAASAVDSAGTLPRSGLGAAAAAALPSSGMFTTTVLSRDGMAAILPGSEMSVAAALSTSSVEAAAALLSSTGRVIAAPSFPDTVAVLPPVKAAAALSLPATAITASQASAHVEAASSGPRAVATLPRRERETVSPDSLLSDRLVMAATADRVSSPIGSLMVSASSSREIKTPLPAFSEVGVTPTDRLSGSVSSSLSLMELTAGPLSQDKIRNDLLIEFICSITRSFYNEYTIIIEMPSQNPKANLLIKRKYQLMNECVRVLDSLRSVVTEKERELFLQILCRITFQQTKLHKLFLGKTLKTTSSGGELRNKLNDKKYQILKQEILGNTGKIKYDFLRNFACQKVLLNIGETSVQHFLFSTEHNVLKNLKLKNMKLLLKKQMLWFSGSNRYLK